MGNLIVLIAIMIYSAVVGVGYIKDRKEKLYEKNQTHR